MSPFRITQAERSAWQWRAATELVSLLNTHQDLPVIAWTVGPAGSNLVGHVNGLAPAATVQDTFDSRRMALALGEPSRTASRGSVYLRALTYRKGVRVALTATVFDDEGEGL